VSEAFAEFEGCGEALAGQFVLAEAQVGDAAEVETVGASPGELTVGVLGAVERVAGVLEGFARVAGREIGFGEGEADVDGVFSEAAGVGEEDAGLGFGDGLGVIAASLASSSSPENVARTHSRSRYALNSCSFWTALKISGALYGSETSRFSSLVSVHLALGSTRKANTGLPACLAASTSSQVMERSPSPPSSIGGT